jgi:lysylphosphatidylglycerol synthetase-like protein (DUF2156 family)
MPSDPIRLAPSRAFARWLVSLLIFLVVAALVVAVARSFAETLDYRALVRALRETSLRAIFCSAAATAISLLCLIARDATVLRMTQIRATLAATLIAGFCSAAVSNAVGLGGFTGAAVRYRIYAAVGMRADAIARVAVSIVVGFIVGLLVVGAAAVFVEAPVLAGLLALPAIAIRAAALLVIASMATLALSLRGRGFKIGDVVVEAPSAGSLTAQIALVAVYLLAAAFAFWSLLPASALNFATFLPLFVLAMAAGGVSHVPGGLGVFEAIMLSTLHDRLPAEALAAALIAFRLIYFILPMYVAAAIVARQERSEAGLVAMGDKSLMLSASGEAFLMYANRGRSWIALFDPVGPRAEWSELIWRFVELAAAHRGRAAFYQARPESLPLFADAGLRIIKIGEEARVNLRDFTLRGGRRSHLRYALKRGERDGMTFELILEPAAGVAMTPLLEAISDDWRLARGAREKRFSVAAFDPAFVARQAVALVRANGRPTAFATIMTTASKSDATVALMRQRRDASPYAMEYLFVRVIEAFRQAGYLELSLGMAPLSGLPSSPAASPWNRVGNLIWRHGANLYNFQGVRTFKSKFDPDWEPRYLAVSGALGPFFALADATALINNTGAATLAS